MNKFGAKKTEVNGIVFDSKAEARRYSQLVALERAGHIAGLTRQVPFVLAPAVKLEGAKRTKPALRYVADFVYSDTKTGKIVVEDVKSEATKKLPAYRIKKHMMATVHGIQIHET